jgi:hypothetical protein
MLYQLSYPGGSTRFARSPQAVSRTVLSERSESKDTECKFFYGRRPLDEESESMAFW